MSNTILAIAGLLSILDPEGVVATAPSGYQAVPLGTVAPTAPEVPPVSSQAITPHGLTTAEQIDGWLAARTAGDRPFADDTDTWSRRDDRKIHGEVSAGIGTGDYSAYSAAVSLPIGETGRLDLRYSESKNDPWSGPYGYARHYGGYEPSGQSRSVGIRFESDSSSRERRPARRRADGLDAWHDRPRDPTAPLSVLED